MSDNRYQDRKRDNPQIWRWAVAEDTDLRTIDRGYNTTRGGAELAVAKWNEIYAPRRFRVVERKVPA